MIHDTRSSCAELRSFSFLNQEMHALSMAQTVDLISSRITTGQFTQHVVVNVAKLVNIQRDSVLKESIGSCDIINIDGMGVVWGARLCGHAVPERVAGVDLFLNLLEASAAKGYSVFFLGARPEIVEKTAANMVDRYPGLKVAGFHHGYFWDDEESVVEMIRNSGSELLFVAISSPKKENFINKWKDRLGVRFVMGVGGTFDVVAGKTKRAPVWMQKCGMEWLYRVIQEPRRMWKRYLVTNSKYLFLLLREYSFNKTR
jgi:N-acetylglucosaminyldiphosphoundecaprenol N-acetyl-beta-D-mannosaminyltransferase